MLFLSRLLGKPILDEQGDNIATLKDLVVRMAGIHPSIIGLVARVGRRDFFIPISRVLTLDEQAARLSSYDINLQRFARRDGEILLGKDVLDKQLIDLNGRRIVRVNDLQIERSDGSYLVIGVDVSPQALLRRLAPRQFFGKATRNEIIDWANVEYLAADAPAVRLKVSHDRLARLHPTDLARIVQSLPYAQGAEIVDSLDDETIADALEQMNEDRQADILEGMEPARAADILEKMSPDDAADVLATMPETEADELMRLMEADESAEVKQLLSYPKDEAGGLMTTEYIAVPQQFTALDTLNYIRALEVKPDVIYYVYVLASQYDRRLVGSSTLRDIILAAPDTTLSTIMQPDPVAVAPDESAEDVARTIAEYNLLALPVVDEHRHVLGIVTVDDALEVVLPETWRQRLPRIFS